jgi:hypothetical protein
MPKLGEVCHVRSKNAGPFWVTIDLFFHDQASYRRYRDAPTLGPALFEHHFGVPTEQVKRLPVDGLYVIKISFPRAQPQGWVGERDMHAGQYFARLLDAELDPAPTG